MNVAPSATYEAVIDVGTTGLAGTIGTRVNDNTGTTTTAFSSAAITEIATGVYAATGRTAPATGGQYSLIWTEGVSGTVLGVEDLLVRAGAFIGQTGGYYGTVAELARILKIRVPSAEQTAAMERVLMVAATEIDAEIDLETAYEEDEVPALVVQVALDRAADLWHHTESATGLTGMLGDAESFATPGRYSWRRYADRLAPLKEQWGLA